MRAAGNRKEDRATVFDMPAPLANRFLHLDVGPDLESFLRFGAETSLDERIAASLSFRPQLLHALDPKRPAWPSPRSWMMASRLLAERLDIGPAVGEAAAGEFAGFLGVYASLPDLDRILDGDGDGDTATFPEEPPARYALVLGLATRAGAAERGMHGFRWLVGRADAEWCSSTLATSGCGCASAVSSARWRRWRRPIRPSVGSRPIAPRSPDTHRRREQVVITRCRVGAGPRSGHGPGATGRPHPLAAARRA